MRLKRAALLTFLLMVALIVGTGRWLRGQQRQYALNRQLIAALVKGDDKQALILVSAGADPNTRYKSAPVPSLLQQMKQLLHRSPPPTNDSPTALLIACGAWWNDDDATINTQNNRMDAPRLVTAMLEHRAKTDVKDKDGWTALMWAERQHLRSSAVVLLDHGADVNTRNNDGETPLMVAVGCATDATPLTRLLLKHGADVNAVNLVNGQRGWTPLICAVRDHQPSNLVKLLLDHGAKINAREHEDGWTPLTVAVRFNDQPDVVRLLLTRKATVNVKDNYGWTPLMVAARYNEDSANIRLLLRHGANPKVRDSWGWTVLHCAVHNPFFRDEASAKDVVRQLLAQGANPNLTNNEGVTPLQFARERHSPHLVALLRQAGDKK